MEDEKQKRLLGVIIDSGKKLHSLSENILAITKMEGNLFNISKETFDPSLVIMDIIKDCENKIKKCRNSIVNLRKK